MKQQRPKLSIECRANGYDVWISTVITRNCDTGTVFAEKFVTVVIIAAVYFIEFFFVQTDASDTVHLFCLLQILFSKSSAVCSTVVVPIRRCVVCVHGFHASGFMYAQRIDKRLLHACE